MRSFKEIRNAAVMIAAMLVAGATVFAVKSHSSGVKSPSPELVLQKPVPAVKQPAEDGSIPGAERIPEIENKLAEAEKIEILERTRQRFSMENESLKSAAEASTASQPRNQGFLEKQPQELIVRPMDSANRPVAAESRYFPQPSDQARERALESNANFLRRNVKIANGEEPEPQQIQQTPCEQGRQRTPSNLQSSSISLPRAEIPKIVVPKVYAPAPSVPLRNVSLRAPPRARSDCGCE